VACSATVAWVGTVADATALSVWDVEVVEERVWHRHPRRKVYRVVAFDDDSAAMAGIRSFEAEFPATWAPPPTSILIH
jgi:hypothetical protein